MYQAKPSRLFRRYALPQMIGLLLNSIYFIVDGVFIGIRLGRDAMAAAAVSVPVVEILIAIALLVSSGAGIIISSMLGQKKTRDANNIFNLAVYVLAVVSVLIAAFGSLFVGELATFLGATPEIHAEAVTYLIYIISLSQFLLFSFFLSSVARNDNRPKLAMTALVVGSLSNILLDYVFMYPLNMGIAGASLATALGPILSVIILLPHFLRKRGYLYFARFKNVQNYIPKIFMLGFPQFIMEFTIGIVTFIYNFAIIKYGFGELGLAAYLIIGYIALIILTLFLGAAQGLQPIFSYYDGSKEVNRAKSLLSFSTRVIIGLGAFLYLLVLLFSKPFVSIFAPTDPELVLTTCEIASIYFFGFVFAGFNILMISFMQALRQTKRALTISLLRSIIVLPIIISLLPLIFGSESIWICHSVSEVLTALIALVLYLSYSKKMNR